MKKTKLSSSNTEFVFIGWQETIAGNNIALYNITAANHPSFGSTVSEKAQNMINLKIPKKHGSKIKDKKLSD